LQLEEEVKLQNTSKCNKTEVWLTAYQFYLDEVRWLNNSKQVSFHLVSDYQSSVREPKTTRRPNIPNPPGTRRYYARVSTEELLITRV